MSDSLEMLSVTDHDGGIREIALTRAPVNALNPDFLGVIAAEAERAGADEDVRAVLLTSPFKVFSAGVDLREMQGYDLAGEARIIDGLNGGFLALYRLPKPLVCAANGAAIAGGFFFPMCADLTISVPGAKFGLAELRVGASFPVGAMEIARAELTPAGLRRLMLTGRPVDAETALAMGIVDQLVEPATLHETALAAARDLAAAPAETYATIKRQIRGDVIDRIAAAHESGSDPVRAGWFTEATKAAMAAALAR